MIAKPAPFDLQSDTTASCMEPNGSAKAQGTSPGDLILSQRKDTTSAVVPQPSGEGGVFSQLANNPLFTAVGCLLSVDASYSS
jgi:mitochondrial chaperone BCS1